MCHGGALGLSFLFMVVSEKPQLPLESLLFGLILGLALLTKNNTPIFFVGPLLMNFILAALKYLSLADLINFQIKQLIIAGTTSLIVILPWLLLARTSGITIRYFYTTTKLPCYR